MVPPRLEKSFVESGVPDAASYLETAQSFQGKPSDVPLKTGGGGDRSQVAQSLLDGDRSTFREDRRNRRYFVGALSARGIAGEGSSLHIVDALLGFGGVAGAPMRGVHQLFRIAIALFVASLIAANAQKYCRGRIARLSAPGSSKPIRPSNHWLGDRCPRIAARTQSTIAPGGVGLRRNLWSTSESSSGVRKSPEQTMIAQPRR